MKPVLLSVCLLLIFSQLSYAEVAKRSDSIADAVGVDIHLEFADTAYGYYPDLVVSLLSQSGIRYYRGAVTTWEPNVVYPLYNRLAALGMKGDYIVQYTDTPTQELAFLQKVHNIAAFEYQNEVDNNGDPNWAAKTRVFGSTFYSSVHQLFPGIPVVGPSLVYSNSPKQLGPVPMDVNNLHFYVRNYAPDIDYAPSTPVSMDAGQGPCMHNKAGDWDCFPGLKYAQDNGSTDGPTAPFWITETGYTTSGTSLSLPAAYEPAYFTREVLWALENNVSKVFFYELLDEYASGTYGMIDQAMQPKPGFTALSSMIHLMADPGVVFTPGNLDFSLTGGDSFLKHGLYQRSDGTFYLVVWQAKAGWDGAQDITPAPETVSLAVVGKTINTAYMLQQNGYFTATSVGKTSFSLSVGDKPIFIAIK